MTNWETLHAYRREVDAGRLPRIVCDDCQSELIPIADKYHKNEPAFKCYGCAIIYHIGPEWFEKISKALTRAYDHNEASYEKA